VLSQSEEYPLAQASRLASCFRLAHPVEAHDFPDKGNINQHTFLVHAGTPQPTEYLLQRINERVFTRPRSVMRAMIASIEAQRASVAAGRLTPGDEWEAITLLDTHEGLPYLDVENHRGYSCWRLMIKIPESRTYKSLGEIAEPAERLRVAGEAGRGLAIYGDFTCRMRTENLENPLPGYRDTRLYYDQLRSVLAGYRTPGEAGGLLPADPTVRHSTEEHFLVHLEEPEYRRRDPRRYQARQLPVFHPHGARQGARGPRHDHAPQLARRLGRHGEVAGECRGGKRAGPVARARRHGRLPRGSARLSLDGAGSDAG
jgi:hypothetical protein